MKETTGSSVTWWPKFKLMVDDAPVEVCQVGLPREPLDFVEEARRKGHPRMFALHLPEVVRQVLDENILGSPLDLARTRIQFLWEMDAAR